MIRYYFVFSVTPSISHDNSRKYLLIDVVNLMKEEELPELPPFILLLTNKFLKEKLTDLEKECLEQWLDVSAKNRQLFLKEAGKIKFKNEESKNLQLLKP